MSGFSKEQKKWIGMMILFHAVVLLFFFVSSASAGEFLMTSTGAKVYVYFFAIPYQLLLVLCDSYMNVPTMVRLGSREKIWGKWVKTTYLWTVIFTGVWLALFCIYCFVGWLTRPGYLSDFSVGYLILRMLHLFFNTLILCNLSLILRLSGNAGLAKGAYLLAMVFMYAETLALKRWIDANTSFELCVLFNWSLRQDIPSLIIQIILICAMMLFLRRLCLEEDLL